jgi:hypothetical protein
VPKARTPSTWVTVLASQPSVSMETDTTQRMEPPSRPALPTVFMTSRSRSWSVSLSASARLPVRSMISRRKRSISSLAAIVEGLVERPRRTRAARCRSAACAGAARGCRARRSCGTAPAVPSRAWSVAIVVLAMEARDVVVDQLGGGRVVADHNEAGRHARCPLLPQLIGLLVVAIERLKRRLEFAREGSAGQADLALPSALLGHVAFGCAPRGCGTLASRPGQVVERPGRAAA